MSASETNLKNADQQTKINADLAEQLGYRQIQYLCAGGFGAVSVVQKNDDKKAKEIVMKRVSTTSNEYKDEIEIHEDLNGGMHPNVIALLSCEYVDDYAAIFMEYANQNTLLSHVDSNWTLKTIHGFFTQLISGLHYIHGRGYCHRDIKSENLLISWGTLKICDFGVACRYRNQHGTFDVESGYGTAHTWAPENFGEDDVNGPALDVWSTGVVLVEMIGGDIPWSQANALEDGEFARYEKNPKWTNKEFRIINRKDSRIMGLVRKILHIDAAKRSTIAQIQQNNWFKNFERPRNQMDTAAGTSAGRKRTYEETFQAQVLAMPEKRVKTLKQKCKCCQ
ncbi:hypothetical protein GCK72_025993 [Caenorhabditis remanei]|uniref:Protein kinase domain-containing protein n=1 Tax=Caenorhabditis remanei TaxID=31234 RepID=A0A6A5G494_CAERE|nr:hypothetical protein GCK72_025993 [Caenorhabditis remanei]KAF1749525.1 hypothetical protein GCK72_025993 [Caenorhabditis remanei]